MKGKRIYPNDDGRLSDIERGDYGRDGNGDWWIMAPSGYCGRLLNHPVEEHDDGTITVTGSILSAPGIGEQWYYHGWLRRGEWTTA